MVSVAPAVAAYSCHLQKLQVPNIPTHAMSYAEGRPAPPRTSLDSIGMRQSRERFKAHSYTVVTPCAHGCIKDHRHIEDIEAKPGWLTWRGHQY